MNSSVRSAADGLFEPVRLGRYELTNRIVMAPLTRSRANADGTPRLLAAEYYRQRASAGLIVAEGTNISPQGRGYAFTPGIYTKAQIEAWQPITEAVHGEGGRIFVQLWHVGRISHPSLQPDGALPVAPSAIRPAGNAFTEKGYQPCVTPRPLETDEMPDIIEQYRHAADCALAAGFDGVEIHAANGYLLEQFLRDSTNQRTDVYGGSRENRARLLLEVTEAVSRVCGGDRVGVRLSPITPANDVGADSDPQALYGYVVEQLNAFDLAYIHVIEGATQGPRPAPSEFDFAMLRRAFKSLYIANNGYDLKLAQDARRSGLSDLIAFGRLYISNPDLVERLRLGASLKEPNAATFFGGGAEGYTDYPFLTPAQRDAALRNRTVKRQHRSVTMKNLPLSKVYQLLEPGPVVLLTTAHKGRVNVMTMSWHMMVEFEPPLIACAVSNGDYSFAALRATRECVIAIPAVGMAPKVVKVGNCSGRDVQKFEKFGLTPLPSQRVAPPLVGECFANLECKVVNTSLVNTYNIFVLEVLKAWTDPGQKNPKTIHHQGYGKFVVDGETIRLKSRMA